MFGLWCVVDVATDQRGVGVLTEEGERSCRGQGQREEGERGDCTALRSYCDRF